MESKQLDEKFVSTDLEEMQKKFEKEKFETQIELEQHQKQIQSLLSHEAKTMKIQQWNSKITKLLIKSLSENRNADEILKELKDFTI